MHQESISKKISRFNWCDSAFYPYIEKVLIRLPKEICFESVLEDLNFEIISFGNDCMGVFFPLTTQIKNLIVLNENILKEPEFEIICTIAHEIAHKTLGMGEIRLHERLVDGLLVKWGFREELEKVGRTREWLEEGGYELGYRWASKQKDLSRFEGYYSEWDQGKLDWERWEEFCNEANVDSIMDEIWAEEVKGKSEAELIKARIDRIENNRSYGIVYGIMGFLKKGKQNALRRLSIRII